MRVVPCSGKKPCSRLVSISQVAGGNPVARDNPESYAVDWTRCSCGAFTCDRCLAAQGGACACGTSAALLSDAEKVEIALGGPPPAPSSTPLLPVLDGIARQIEEERAKDNLDRARALGALAATVVETQGTSAPEDELGAIVQWGERFHEWAIPAEGARYAKATLQLLGAPEVYIHQTKINYKRALSGDRWDWHQDLQYWHHLDGLPSSGAISAAVFLDDVDPLCGPLLLAPGSHAAGMVDLPLHGAYGDGADWESSFSSNLTFRVDPATLERVLGGRSVFAATGEAGFVLFFNDLVFHGSGSNMSWRDRTSIYVTYNSTANRPRPVPKPRPDFVACRDFTPLTELVSSLD